MDPNQLAQTLVQRGGYNPIDAANAARGPRATELAREFGVGNPAISGATTAASGDVLGQARQLLGFQREAAQPAIQTLQAQESPLKARYSAVLESLKGKEQQAISTAQTAAAQEFGKRGIPLSSGAYADFLQSRTLPISTQFGGLQAETALAEQKDLMDLASRVAQLQGGDVSSALSTAVNLSASQKAAEQAQAEQAYREKVYKETTLPESQASIANVRSQIGQRGKKTSIADVLRNIFNQGGAGAVSATPTETPPAYSPGKEGATSPQGQWIYMGGRWLPIVD